METSDSHEVEIPPTPINREELIDLYEQFDAKRDKTPEDHQRFLEELLEMKDRFAHVFRGEGGSRYFMTHTGQSLDIMGFNGRPQDGEVWVTNPFERIFFVTPEEVTRVRGNFLYEEDSIDAYIAEGTLPIKTVPFQVSAVPVEVIPLNAHYNRTNKREEFSITEGDNTIIIATKYENTDAHHQHFGHPVTEILK